MALWHQYPLRLAQRIMRAALEFQHMGKQDDVDTIRQKGQLTSHAPYTLVRQSANGIIETYDRSVVNTATRQHVRTAQMTDLNEMISKQIREGLIKFLDLSPQHQPPRRRREPPVNLTAVRRREE